MHYEYFQTPFRAHHNSEPPRHLSEALKLYDLTNGRLYDTTRNPGDVFTPQRTAELALKLQANDLITASLSEREGHPVGMAAFHVESDDDQIWVDGLAVRGNFQRQGIGRDLLRIVEERGRAAGVGRIALESTGGAMHFYQRLDFERSTESYRGFIKPLDP